MDNGSNDACGIQSLVLSQTAFVCSEVGANTEVLTVTDVNNNVTTCTTTVTVEDNVAPIAICQNVTVQLNNTGPRLHHGRCWWTTAAKTPAASRALSLSQTAFVCSEVGANTEVLTVTDVNGNSTTCATTITVEDNVAPVAVCQSITVQLDPSGNASITASQVNNGSSDACGIASLALNITTFNCANVNGNTVILTVTDVNGNSSTCSANVTIEDNVAPIALCQNVTVQLDITGNGSTTAAPVNNGSSDNCAIATLALSQTAFVCSEMGANTEVLTVTDVNGNSTTCSTTITVEDNVAPVAVCQNITVQLDPSGNASITASQVNNGSSDACGIASLALNITTFSCANVNGNTVILTVTDVNGNSSTCSANVTIQDNVAPIALCQNVTVQLDNTGNGSTTAAAVNNGSSDNCAIATLALSQTAFVCSEVGVNTEVLTVTDVNGNSTTCSTTITVEDNVAPVAVCQSITVQLDPSGNASITPSQVNNGSSDACGIASLALNITTFNCANVNGNTVILTVTDVNGNSSTCSANVTIQDNVAPIALCQNVTVQLDNTGNGLTTTSAVNNGSSDNCAIATLALSQTAFVCSEVGANTEVLTVTDVNGNSTTCSTTITVEDNVAPVAVCQNITVQLDPSGNASITASQVDNGSNDACGIASLALNITTFNCANVNGNTVILTVTDVNGNSSTCSANVTIQDNVAPIAVCQNVTVQLDNTGNGSTTASAVNNGSSDNCAIATLALSQTAFVCSEVGANTEVLTVTDVNGNSTTCSTTITVEDNVAPIAVCQNITVQLDPSGNAGITASQVNNGSSDACGIASLALNITTFNCANVNGNTVILTVTDLNSNSSTCSANVTIEDNVAPIALCQNVTVQLDNTGNGSTTAAAVNNGSSDNCAIATLALSQTAFVCSEVGANTEVLTVTDVNGNSTTCSTAITVEDNVAPVAVCQNITVQLDNTGNGSTTATAVNNGSSDACGIQSLALSQTAFVCSEVGANTEVLTVTDVNGNSTTCSTTIAVEDNVAPIALCQNITVQLDPSGNATITASQVNNGSSDACGIASLALNITTFNCANVNGNTVILTVTDVNGNSSTCSANVTIQDNVAPIAVCQNVTVQLDNTGNGSTTAAAVNNGSSDNCAIATLAVSQTAFVCSEVGANTEVLTVTDVNGNSTTCSTTITVQDNVAPVAVCQNITVQLDNAGNGSTTATAVNNGSSDACGIQSLALSQTAFVCSEVGANTEVLTVTDVNGNSTTCSTTITVEDNVAPVAVCQNITVQLDPSGNASITASQVNNGSSDACGIQSLALSQTAFVCSEVGANTEVLTVNDVNGNSTTCSTTITVEDNVAPIAVCQNITVQLDPSGNASITASQVNNGSSDACGIASLALNITTFNCANVNGNTVILTVTDVNGNNSTCSANVTIEDNVAPIAVCQNVTVQLDNTGNGSTTAAAVNNGSSDNCAIATLALSQTAFVCSEVGANTEVLTVTDVNGNSTTCSTTITVEDNVAPVAVCQNITVQLDNTGNGSTTATAVNNGSSDACGIQSLALSQTAFVCSEVGVNTEILTVTDVNGNSTTCSTTITVEDNVTPVAVCQNITVQLDPSGNASITASQVNNGSSDACGIASLALNITTFNCANVNGNTVILTVTDVNGNTSTCSANVTIQDNVAPIALCQNVTVQLDNTGNGSTTAAAVNNASSDNCAIATLALSQTAFVCSEVGANTEVLTVTDVNGNSTTCSTTITVEDNVAPIAICQNLTVQLDNTGNGSTTATAVNNGSFDACGIQSLALSQTAFICSEVGANTEVLTVTDVNGNSTTCSTTITVEDNVAPVAVCQNITVQLDPSGNATITASQVNNGSSDACGIASLGLNITTFNCANVNGNTVILTVTDVNGNSSSCSANVTIEDNVAPIALCQNVTVQLDNTGNGSTTAAAVNNGSSDNCAIATLALSQTAFVCSEVGANTEVLTVTDVNGNSTTCSTTITVEDNVAPVAVCQNITVQLDPSGNASITASQVDNGSNDACGIASLALNITTFNCANVNGNTVILTVTDVNGNSSTCSANVTIQDNVAPIALCQNVTVQLDNTGNGSTTAAAVNNGSSDNCAIATLALSQTAFVCSEVGANTEVLTVTDVNGNSTTCSTTITVEDNVAPVAVCQNITVQLDPSGNASIAASQVNNGSSDACGIASLALNITTFSCANVNGNTVILTVTDVNGNSSTCSANVTIEDIVAPIAICQNLTVQLDNTGNGSTTAAAVNNASSDNCAIATLALSQTAFVCSEVGANTEVLTVTDVNGNSTTCSTTITVEDNVPPVAVCQNITVQLDPSGNASITASQVNNGSSDACGIASLALNITTFNCANVNGNTVILTVTDVNGNSTTCSANVTIEDNVAPIALCQNVTVQLDNTGNGSTTAAAVNNGSSDNCAIATLALSQTAFVCSEVGANTEVLTVTDVNGNSTTCSTTITVEDNVAPVAVCQNITVQLDPSGNATITASQVNNGSSDACGIASLALNITTFNCANVNGNTVILTVTDVNGNSSTCSANVTIQDNVAPIAVCQNVTVQLDNTGNGSTTAAAVNNGSSDNCAIATLALSQTAFVCSEVGANTEVLTVTDVNGNSTTCSTTITVEDNVAPVAVCQNITVQLDNTGNGSTTANAVNNGSSDACGIQSLALSQTAFVCSEVGVNTEVLTVTDVNGNSTTCTTTIAVEDNVAPIAVCQNITVQLDPSGNATITASQVNNGSSDACGIASLALNITTFNCANVNGNTVILTVTDVNGNSTTCSTTITVEDNVAPIALCQNVTVQLDNTGNGSTTAAAVNNGSSDNCAIATLALSQTAFVCSEVGANTEILTVTDVNGNSTTCSTTITVEDNVAPVAVCQNITVQLDPSGNASITASQVNNGSSDACGIASLALNITTFNCANVNGNTVILTVTDVNGNNSTCSANVTIEDNVAPIALCQNVTVQLDNTGNGSTTASAVNNGSSDNCAIATLALSQTAFVCSEVGANTEVLTVTDVNGNSTTCSATITVEDNVAPVAVCQNITVQLDPSGNASITASQVNNGSSDACGIASLALNITTFNCANVNGNTVILTVTDVNGNSSTCSANVTIQDNVAPIAVCQNVTVQLDNTGNGSTTAAAVNNGSSDNCAIATLALSQTAFVCSEVGANTEVLTVTDVNGNSTTCSTTITVEDNVAPVAVCQNITVQLDPSGNASITASQVNNGSSDACGIASLALNITTFNCANVNGNTVILTVTDVNGNSSTCSANVTIQDNVAPIAICQNVTVQLDNTGNGSTTAAAVNNG